MVACTAMAIMKEQEAEKEETQSKKGKWAKVKRGGIIGAAALTGGALLAITGGMESLICFLTVLYFHMNQFPHGMIVFI